MESDADVSLGRGGEQFSPGRGSGADGNNTFVTIAGVLVATVVLYDLLRRNRSPE